jgi:hypothetical protein
VTGLDDYLRLLADERKRRLLRELRAAGDDPVSVDSDDPDEQTRLHHIHLPKLADAGLIDWDPRDDIVVRGPAFDEILPLLETIDRLEASEGDEDTGSDAGSDDGIGDGSADGTSDVGAGVDGGPGEEADAGSADTDGTGETDATDEADAGSADETDATGETDATDETDDRG